MEVLTNDNWLLTIGTFLPLVGVVIMMVVAGLLEAFPRQLVDGHQARFVIGGTFLLFWLAYFYLYHPRKVDVADEATLPDEAAT